MTRRIFKATTALTLSLSLVQPGAVVALPTTIAILPPKATASDLLRGPERIWAAEADCAATPDLPECLASAEPKEAAPEAPGAEVPAPAEAAEAAEPPAAEPDAAVSPESEIAVEPESAPATEPEAAAPVEVAPEPETAAEPVAEPEPVPEVEPEAAAPVEAAPEPDASEPQAGPEVTIETTEPATPEPATPEATAPEAAAPAEPVAAPEATDPVGADPVGADPEAPAETAPETVAPESSAIEPPAPVEAAVADPDGAAEPVETMPDQAVPVADPVVEPTAEQAEVLETLLATPEVAEAVETLSQTDAADAAADGGAPAADAAINALEGAAAPEPVQMTTQTFDEKTARKSDQDFKTKLKTTAPTAVADDDEGMSDLEKAGLVALGAVVVGMLINSSRVVANSGDRVVVDRGDGNLALWKDDNANLRAPGVVETIQRFGDGSTLSTLDRPDGTQIITVRDATGRVIRRDLVQVNGTRVPIIDDTRPSRPVVVSELPRPRLRELNFADTADPALMRALLDEAALTDLGRNFTLAQVRDIRQVRELAPELTANPITFATGSAAIPPDQAGRLARLAGLMNDMIDENPGELFLIEGHTDAVGKAAYNLALSDRRAESVALALSQIFGVPPENMVVQGYGERFLKVQSAGDEPRNRRVAIRNITWLVEGA